MTPPTTRQAVPDAPAAAPARTRPLPVRASWHAAVTLVVLVCTAPLAWRHWPVIEAGAARLAGADPGWLLLGATAAASTWACSAIAQQGAVAEALPGRRLVAAQFAASAANHVLPAGVGAGAVNLRFLTRCGLSVPRSATALAVKATAGAVARGALIALLALAGPGLLRLPRVSPTVVTAALLSIAALSLLLLSGPLRRAVRAVSADVRAVHRLPARAAALWGGSLAFATLHALVVIAVSRALGLPLPPERLALAYLAASSAAVLLPTPGGIGSLDAALALALTLAGVPGSAAASVVIGYRLLTVWLPLVPGLLVLGLLVRRRAL
ncbi:lysylphosphatidylglycerol synthase domain-containing protein [Streptomyces sp. NPDC093261]|uniref:lysylphosphatidylglycerol synthase domain-containing protein n=1 Tax=Streptomyces sp. NPDC093261 TaxID=3366037 RepID=UPI00382E6F57